MVLHICYFLSKPFYEPIYMQVFTMFSGKTLFIFYIFTLMRLLQKEKWQTLLRPFQHVGRMALTNYISHTIVTLLVFGLFLKIIILLHYGLPIFCISFYTLQIFISRWWLSHYQYGPLEYIWRLGTYGKMMPLKEKQGLITRPCFSRFSYCTLHRYWLFFYFHFAAAPY